MAKPRRRPVPREVAKPRRRPVPREVLEAIYEDAVWAAADALRRKYMNRANNALELAARAVDLGAQRPGRIGFNR